MKLNETRITYVEANKKHVHVEYCFTKDQGKGKPGEQKVRAVISFIHPETRQKERLQIVEQQEILKSTEDEIHTFIEMEIECFLQHCKEYN